MKAKEWNGDLVFLHEAGPGHADRSYGVQVAKLAGVPPAVVARAREVLERLESEAESPARLEGLPLFAAAAPTPVKHGPSPVEEALKGLEPDGMSPARGDGSALSAEGDALGSQVAKQLRQIP
jgi:DNA mismatch repair protein MutS